MSISVITAATRPHLLKGLYDSLQDQDACWEWIIQLDGEGIAWQAAAEDDAWLADPRVRVERNAKPYGSGTTRNQALARATTDRIICVDDDDRLLPRCLGALSRALHGHRECFGAWGRTYTTKNGGKTHELFRSWPGEYEAVLHAGTIGSLFEQRGLFAVHVGSVLWRREYLVAAGGYAALPRSIDTNPFLACEAIAPTVYVDLPVYLYHQHDGQMTREQGYVEMRDRVHALTFERAREVSRLFRASRPA